MRCFCSSRGGKDGYVFCPDVATISTCHRYNYRSFRQESRTSTQRSPLRNGMERCTTLTAICRCLSTRKALFRLSGFLVLNWSSMAMRLRPRFAGIRGAAGHRQTLREAFRKAGAAAFFAPAKRRSASKLTEQVSQQAQELWNRTQGQVKWNIGNGTGMVEHRDRSNISWNIGNPKLGTSEYRDTSEFSPTSRIRGDSEFRDRSDKQGLQK